MRGVVRPGLGAVVVACALVFCSGAQANRLVTIKIKDRHHYVPSQWYGYSGPPRARVLLPNDYRRQRAYPLVLLLHGLSNNYATYSDPDTMDVQRLFAHVNAIVVMPEGASGWWLDWFNNGARGTPRWESYVLGEVLPQIRHRYRLRSGRRWHSLFGNSMGGLGAAYIGGRLPAYFGSVVLLSGFLDLQVAPDVVSAGMDVESGAPPGSVIGPEDGFYATGHNPTALVDNLKYTRVFETVGDGTPTPADGTGGGVGNAEEAAIIRPMSDNFHAAAKAAGVPVTYETHHGCHCYPDFREEIRKAIDWGPFKRPPARPRSWVNDTVATHGRLWGIRYRFRRPPDAVVRFHRSGRSLSVGAAGSAVTLTKRGCTLHVTTPATVRLPKRRCR